MARNNPRGRAEGRDAELADPILAAVLPLYVPKNAANASTTYALPLLSETVPGRVIFVQKTDATANTVTITTARAQDRINNPVGNSFTQLVLSTPGASAQLVADPSGWGFLNQANATGSNNNLGTPALQFTTAAPPDTTINVATATVTVQRLDGSGVADTANALTLGLLTTGGVYLDNSTGAVITSVTIPAGSSSASFKFRAAAAGAYTINVTAPGYVPITQQVTVAAGAALPTKLVFLSPAADLTNSVVSTQTFTVQLQDASGVPVNTVGARTVNLSSTGTGTFYRLDGTTVDAAPVMADGTSTISFRYKDTANGTPTITAQDSSGAATVSIDGSSPVTAFQTDTSLSVTTASFTPPVLSRLVARVSCNGASADTITITDSRNLTWVAAPGNVQTRAADVAIFTAWQPLSQSMTVTATRTASATPGIDLRVDVLTGSESAWGGASLSASGSTGLPSGVITTTRTGSIVLAVSSDKNARGAATAGTTQTLQDEVLSTGGTTSTGATFLAIGTDSAVITSAPGTGLTESRDPSSGPTGVAPIIGVGGNWQTGLNTAPFTTLSSTTAWGAIGVQLLGGGTAITLPDSIEYQSTADSNNYSGISSHTWTLGALVLLVIDHSGPASTLPNVGTTPVSNALSNVTFVGSIVYTSGTEQRRLELWSAKGTGNADVTAAGYSGQTQTSIVVKMFQFNNVTTTSGALGNGVEQFNVASGSSVTPAVTLASGTAGTHEQHNWRYNGNPAAGALTLNLATATGQDWNMAAIEVRQGPGTITSATQVETVSAATGTGGGTSTLSQSKNASEFVWWGGNYAWYWLLNTGLLDGSNAWGPTTPAGNRVIKSFAGSYGDGWPIGLGGGENWSTSATLAGSSQNQIISTNFNTNVRAGGGRWFLGFRLWDHTTVAPATGKAPAIDWYNDALWTTLTTDLGQRAAAAKRLGAAGFGWDLEQNDNIATWRWDYTATANEPAGQTQAQRRAKARARGAQIMAAIVANYPGIEIGCYNAREFGGGVDPAIQVNAGNQPTIDAVNTNQLAIDFFDGMFDSAAGIGAFYAFEADFYQPEAEFGNPPSAATLDRTHWYGQNDKFAWMSRKISNWVNMASKFHHVAFLATEGDGTTYLKPVAAATKQLQLEAARRWNMAGLLPVFLTGEFQQNTFDYTTGADPRGANFTGSGNYRPALNAAAATPTSVQTTAPTLTTLAVSGTAASFTVTGRAASHGITGCADAIADGAVRQVRVSSPATGVKTAQMTLKMATGLAPTVADLHTTIPTGWYQEWTVTFTGGTATQTITIVAEDTHLNTTTNTSLAVPT